MSALPPATPLAPAAVVAVAATPVECLLEWARRRPHHRALAGYGWRVDYGTLAAGVREAAHWLAQKGVQSGDTVALSLDEPTGKRAGVLTQIELFFGAALAGACVLPMYAGAPAERVTLLMRHFGATHWLSQHARILDGASDTDEPARLDIHQYEQTRAQTSGQTLAQMRAPAVASAKNTARNPVQADLDPARPFFYDYTSGTTDTPRLVLHSHANYLLNLFAAARQLDRQDDDVLLTASPWPSKVGVRGVLRALSSGYTCVQEAFPEDRANLDKLMGELGVNTLIASPLQIRRLLPAPTGPRDGLQPAALAPLRRICVTGVAVLADELLAFRRQICAAAQVDYASTETGVIGSVKPGDAPDAPLTLAAGMQAQALDAHGQPLGPGQSGRLRFKSPWINSSYARNPEATAQSFKDGWFYSTDTGYMDTEGRLCLQGRADDAINLGGVKIYPRDVEAALLAHPDVQDAAVIAYPEPQVGEIPVAFVQFRRPVSMAALRAWLTGRLYHWQMPRGLVVMQTLPRTPDGKLLAASLRETYRKMGEGQA